MIYPYIFTPRALVQYKNAYEWYWERSEMAADNFKIALMEQVQQICLSPTLYRNTTKRFRESQLRKYPFLIIYMVNQKKKAVVITSIFHNRRNPQTKYKA